jgi:hypothetical protein
VRNDRDTAPAPTVRGRTRRVYETATRQMRTNPKAGLHLTRSREITHSTVTLGYSGVDLVVGMAPEQIPENLHECHEPNKHRRAYPTRLVANTETTEAKLPYPALPDDNRAGQGGG